MQLGTEEVFNYGLSFYFLALFIVIVSKRLMYAFRDRVGERFGRYLLWNILEILLIAVCYVILLRVGVSKGLFTMNLPVGLLLVRAFLYFLISLGFPYLLAGMFFAIRDKDQTIRMINYGNVVSDEDLPSHEEQKITLFDNNGVMKLSVSASNLFYIESDDNYIKVWYTDSKDILKQYMLRCRLKTIEESFRDSDLMRCHRKYIVNMSKVRVLSREKNAYFLQLDSDLIAPIPITKTYEDAVLARFYAQQGGLSAPLS